MIFFIKEIINLLLSFINCQLNNNKKFIFYNLFFYVLKKIKYFKVLNKTKHSHICFEQL
ncbi:hypothetical protein GUU_04254 [Malacoplasma iowae 695]|nr:hypothetical protein GUU_04254 [Malacoplasma iowae 695]